MTNNSLAKIFIVIYDKPPTASQLPPFTEYLTLIKVI